MAWNLAGISLNANKNWDLLDKNHLRSSQDDIQVDYGRVVDVEFDPRLNKTAQRVEIYHRIYGTNKVTETDDESNNNEPEYVSGTNRKGHFIKQKRKQGKKGVKGYANAENNNNNNITTEQNAKSQSRDSSGADSDSDDEPKESSKIVLVQRHNPKTNYHLEQYPTSWSYRCSCETCMGVVDKKQRRRQAQRDIEALDLSAL